MPYNYYQWSNPSIIVRLHDQGPSKVIKVSPRTKFGNHMSNGSAVGPLTGTQTERSLGSV